MKNYYKPAAQVWAQRKGLTLREWLKGWTMEDALLTVEYSSPLNPSDRAEDAAMWMWYMAARKAGDKLTFNADEMTGDIRLWKWAASMAPNLIHPDVFSLCRPYQLVIS